MFDPEQITGKFCREIRAKYAIARHSSFWSAPEKNQIIKEMQSFQNQQTEGFK